MIAYLDTSSLVKLYVEESDSDRVRDLVESVDVVATSRVAYTEAMAAFGRRLREKSFSRKEFREMIRALERDWQHFAVLDLNEVAAGALAIKHALRASDAIHLEAALAIRQQAKGNEVGFSSFDGALNAAASREGLRVIGLEPRITRMDHRP
jgi:predicted nucleic acid-binding protein